MMSSQHRTDEAVWPEAPPPSLSWRSWPLRETMVGAVLVTSGLAAAGLAIRLLTGQAHLALLAAAALAVALWRFFLPVSFELNAEGVNQWLFGRHKRIAWSAIRRYEVRPGGVLLLPFADRCPMDSFRGLYLPWTGHRDEILAHLHYYLDRPPD